METLYFGVPLWAWAAIAVVILVLLIGIAMRARGTKRPAAEAASVQPQSPPPAATATLSQPAAPLAAEPANVVSVDFAGGDLFGFISMDGATPAPGQIVDGWWEVRAWDAAHSLASLPAKPGQKFRCRYEARLAAPGGNGIPTTYFVGLTALDQSGRVVFAWVGQPPIDEETGVRSGVVEAEMPAGVATVHVGVHGPAWEGHSASDGRVGFRRFELSAV